MRRLLPAAAGKRPRVLAARMEQLARLAGQPVPQERLRSMQRREVMRFTTSLFDLALDPRLRTSSAELEQLLDEPPPDWRRRELGFAAYLTSSDLIAQPGEAQVSDVEAEELLFPLATYLGVLEKRTTRYLTLVQGRLHVGTSNGRRAIELPGSFATFRQRGETLRAAPLELVAGDRVDLYLHRGQLAALAQPIDAPEVHFGDRAPKRSWTRFKSRGELRSAVQTRYPGFPFEGFEILSRGVSGRVGKLRLLGSRPAPL